MDGVQFPAFPPIACFRASQSVSRIEFQRIQQLDFSDRLAVPNEVPGRARPTDLLIASTAAARDLLPYTRNPADFSPLKLILKVLRIWLGRSGRMEEHVAATHCCLGGGIVSKYASHRRRAVLSAPLR